MTAYAIDLQHMTDTLAELAANETTEYLAGFRAGSDGSTPAIDRLRSVGFLRGLRRGYLERSNHFADLASAAFTRAHTATIEGRPAHELWTEHIKLDEESWRLYRLGGGNR